MAVLHAKGQANGLHTDFLHEGILGTVFRGRLLEETTIGGPPRRRADDRRAEPGSPASRSTSIDPSDPFPEGYTIGDI